MLRMFVAGLAGFALMLSVAACTFQASNLGGNEELNAEATVIYGLLAARQDDQLLDQFAARVDRAEAQAQLPMLHDFIPEGPPPEAEVIGTQNYTGTEGRTYTVVQTYDYPDRVIQQTTRFVREDDAWRLLAFSANATMKVPPAANAPASAPATGSAV